MGPMRALTGCIAQPTADPFSNRKKSCACNRSRKGHACVFWLCLTRESGSVENEPVEPRNFQPGVDSNAPDSISACCRCCSRHCGRGHRACAGACAINATAGIATCGVSTFVGLIRRRGRFQVDPEAMDCGQGQVGQGKGKMGRLREAGEGPEAHRSKELVVPRFLHDELKRLPKELLTLRLS
jgi:hypothetical protein